MGAKETHIDQTAEGDRPTRWPTSRKEAGYFSPDLFWIIMTTELLYFSPMKRIATGADSTDAAGTIIKRLLGLSSPRMVCGFIFVACLVSVLLSGGASAETVTVAAENESIQDAIDRASAGDTVEIPEGTYNSQLDVDKDITLTNAGSDDVILEYRDDYNYDTFGVTVTAGSATIDDITVRGFQTGILYSPDATADEMGLTVRDVTVLDNSYGIEISADNEDADVSLTAVEARDNEEGITIPNVMGELSVKESELISNDYGIVGNPTTLTVTSTDLNRNDDYGLDISDAESVSITDTTATQNGEDDYDGDNIYITELPTDSDVTIQNVKASAAGDHGVSIDAPQATVSISEVTANRNGDNGLYVSSQSATINDITATGNENGVMSIYTDTSDISSIESQGTDGGIYIEGSKTTISDTTIESNSGDHGIHTVNVPTVSISGSTIRGSSETNIYLESESSNGSFSLTDVTGAKSGSSDGIHIAASSTSNIELNSISATGNSDDGLDISGGEVTASNIKASSNGNVGFLLDSVASATVTELTAAGNEIGVWVGELNTKVTIAGSTITGNSEYSIENNAERTVSASDSTVGLIGTVDEEYITDGVVVGDRVSTKNPELESRVAADFSIDPSPPRAEEQVAFDASTTKVVGGRVTSYEWDLNGDGEPDATGELAETTYKSDGVQEVTLTVVDDEGREDTITKDFEVTPSGISAQISVSDDEITVDEEAVIQFSVVSYLTNQKSDVQLVVQNPSGVQVSSTRGLDESSNQATVTETIEPGESEDVRIMLSPTSPGELSVQAKAVYESVDGEVTGAKSENVTIDVTQAEGSTENGAQTGDASPGFGIFSAIVAFVISVAALRARQ